MNNLNATMSTLDTIPTISATVGATAVSSSPDIRRTNDPQITLASMGTDTYLAADVTQAQMSDSLQAASVSLKQIVQSKFKDNENVLSIFEAYQIKGPENCPRILALVCSEACGTYAIFSLNPTRTPPRHHSDLSIDKIFAIISTFEISIDNKGSISQLQFDLKNSEESSAKYYFYPYITTEEAVDFDYFQCQILSVTKSMPNNVENILSFNWLNDYRQIGEVKQELKRREKEYIILKNFQIYCATWNVNDKSYLDCPLHLWLTTSEKPPDIYAIALQELDTSAKAVTFSESRPDPCWISKMLANVHPDAIYEELTSVRLVGMMLTILIKRDLRRYVSRCRSKVRTRGLLYNTLGNKGGVAVSIQLNESNICFVNSHLAAQMNMVKERNADFAGIVEGIVFDDDLRRTINDHDQVFWIGDLNYRIQVPPGIPWRLDDYDYLLEFDQLRNEMRERRVFDGYTEGPIKFRPTYKYDPGTDDYDSSEKQRAPAYCDRILWKGSNIQQISYNSVMDIRQSDHKPVYALFNVKIKTRDEKKYKKIHEEVLKLVDKMENESQPQITVEKRIIDFGLVYFNQVYVQDFVVTNSCPLNIEIMFKNKEGPLNDICEKWLKVEPRTHKLMTNNSSRIKVELLIDHQSVSSLLKKIRTTNWNFDFDILILHVKNGPDIFITVTGEYKPSCFGLSMETLCRTNLPICEYSQADLKALMNDDSPEFRVTMPREFFLLIDYLHKQGPNMEGAFQSLEFKYIRKKEFNEIREWLDTWSSAEFPGTPLVAAEALMLLLYLPEKSLLDPFVDDLLATNTTAEAMELIAILSSPKRNVFVHLCMFLREGIEKGYYNLYHVSLTFGNILLRGGANKDSFKCRDFMKRFISSDMGTLANQAVIGNESRNSNKSIPHSNLEEFS